METAKDLVSRSEFLRLLPADMQQRVVQKLSEQHFEFGDRIVAEGDPADAYYFILSGKARVVKTMPDGGEVPLDALSSGDSFGEIGLLTGGERTATVRATGRMSVLRLDRSDFESILDGHPTVREYIQMQLEHRQVQGFLRQYSEFSGAPMAAMEAMLQGLSPVTYGAGATIFARGDEPDGMYILESGHVRIYLENDGHQRDLAYLRPGDFFGELSLLAGNPRAATAEAASECHLLKLAPRDYARIMDRFPALRGVIERRMASYRDANDPSAEARMPLDFWQAIHPEATGAGGVAAAPSYLDTPQQELTSTFEIIRGSGGGSFSRRHFQQQVNAADSPAACLIMLARHCGVAVTPERIRSLMADYPPTTAASEVIRDIGRGLGLHLRIGQGDPARLRDLQLPCLALMKGEKWLLITDIAEPRVRVADPAGGLQWLHQDELSATWSRLVIEAPAAGKGALRLPSFWTWARPALTRLSGRGAAAIAGSVLGAIAMVLTVLAVDNALAVLQVDGVAAVSGGAAALYLVCFGLVGVAVFDILRRVCVNALAAGIELSLSAMVDERLIAPSSVTTDSALVAELEEELRMPRQDRRQHIAANLVGALAALEWVLLLGGVALYSPLIAAILVGIAGSGAAFLHLTALRSVGANYERARLHRRQCRRLEADLRAGRETLRSVSAEGHMRRRVMEAQGSQNHAELLVENAVVSARGLSVLLWSLGLLVILLLCTGGQVATTPSGVMAMLALAGLTLLPANRLLGLAVEARGWTRQLSRLLGQLEVQSGGAASQRQPQTVAGLAGRLELRRVSLYYGTPNAPAALRDLSLRIEPGEHVVVVGQSGSGKSAIIRCLAATASPQKGRVMIDDVDSRSLDTDTLRQHLSVVPQDLHIFTGSVTANIALGDESPDLPRVQQAARDAGLHEMIKTLPDGYDTRLGDDGWRLPAGRARALAVARALYRQPDVLLLDDPTAGMDIELQTLIWENIQTRFSGRTVVMVTQQLHLASSADRILVLDRGHIAESGNHEQLMARNGLYYHMWLRVDSASG